MATLKCKMCGGDLELTPDVTVAECPYCGTKQTVPNADNEKKMTLFSRANRLRFNNEFDKAAGVYETIIGEFPEEAEAYWGLVLCKYGIEYVDDPVTAKKIPTCHRSSFDSVMEDENLELAMEYADAVAKRMYREEAKQIEEIRRGILEVSSREEPYDVFICYKETDESGERTLDSVLAQDIYNELTGKGYRVFFSRITLEDKLGQEYEPYIFAALHSARVMLAVGTSYEHYDAVWVKNEWSRYLQLMAAGEKKTLIPCYKDLDAYDMPKEFAKLQAQDLGKVGAMQDLMRGVEKILGKSGEQNASVADTAVDSGLAVMNAQTAALLKRGYIALEDRQFDKATEFFEQVLNNDAECGKAYRGKVFAFYKVCTVNAFIKNLWDKLEKGEKGKEVTLTVNLSDLAREVDAKTQIFSYFTDEELEKLMEVEFGKISLSYDDYRAYYEKQFSLNSLVNKSDFNHAVQYADAEITQEINQICENLTDKLQQRVQVEQLKPFIATRKMEPKKREIKETVKKWLNEAPEKIKSQKAEEEAKAEENYQVSVRAAEAEYEKRMAEWKQAKAAYSAQYAAAAAKQSELQGKIEQLEQEKAQLKGFFTGKKRKELEGNITMLKNSLTEIEMPRDPGEPPIRGELPNRNDFHRDVNTNKDREKNWVAAAVFPDYRKKQLIFEEEVKNLKEASEGDKVYFGKYPYDKNGDKRPIQWRILERRGNSLLLLTEYGIDAKAYHEKIKDITWENCTLRRWLNGDFLNNAFFDSEKKLIQTTNVDNGRTEGNSIYNTDGGNNTEDQVFLLSYKEAFEDYFSSNEERICMPTAYAVQNGAYKKDDTGACWWWLRSPGNYQYSATRVYSGGSPGIDYVRRDDECVRPALWINLESGIF